MQEASDTAEYNDISPFSPTDATTNPSLVFQAISKPEYAHTFDIAVRYANSRLPNASIEDRTNLAMDRLLVEVGFQISKIIPGRVSVSVDPRLGSDTDAIIAKGKLLVSIMEELGVQRGRVLVKIPATYEGIVAAQHLEALPSPIHVNMTLVFGTVQAAACAQAGLSVISPFVGRVLDWHLAHGTFPTPPPLENHPGLLLVQNIKRLYSDNNYKTQVMAAGFRSVDEVIELGEKGIHGGPDIFTLPLAILMDLQSRVGFSTSQTSTPTSTGNTPSPRIYFERNIYDLEDSKASYVADIASERVAFDKVPEGLDKFSVDAVKLEEKLRTLVEIKATNEPVSEKMIGEASELPQWRFRVWKRLANMFSIL